MLKNYFIIALRNLKKNKIIFKNFGFKLDTNNYIGLLINPYNKKKE